MPVATQDHEFIKASPEDQHAYLAQTDPDYAKASPDEQQAYLGHLTGRGNIGTPPPAAGPHVNMQERTLWGYGEPYHRMPGSSEGANFAEAMHDYGTSSVGQLGTAAKDLAHGDVAKGAHHALSAGMNALTPLAGFAPIGTLAKTGAAGYLGGKAARGLSSLATDNPDYQDVAEDVGNIGGGVLGAKSPKISGLREWGMGDPNAATSKALHVTPHSPEMQSTLGEVEGARPYLKGATSQADVQGKLPGAKAEVWEPYNKAVALVKDRIVKGPDGHTTVGDLEAERLKLSAEMQIAQKARPTDTQTAIQAEKQIADMKERYKAITGALDPALESTGIDPAVIRKTHGQLKGVERNVSGKSTVTEPMQPYGLRKMVPSRVPNPLGSEWKWEPIQGAKDIAAGRPLWKGKPTDVAMKDLFSRGGAKPNLGTPRTPRIAGMLPAAPTELPSPMEPLGETSVPAPTQFGTRAERLGLMLPAAPTELPSPMEPLGETSVPAPTQFGTRAERLGLMLPEGATPLKPYGYNEPGMKFPYPRPK